MTTINDKYGLSRVHHHDLDETETCKKCHKHISELSLKVCAVIGEQEFAQYARQS